VKTFVLVLAVLLVLGVLLGLEVVMLAGQPGADCDGRVMIVRGPDGQPRECICQAGVLATCFDPGP
jgi:hypothetical protein